MLRRVYARLAEHNSTREVIERYKRETSANQWGHKGEKWVHKSQYQTKNVRKRSNNFVSLHAVSETQLLLHTIFSGRYIHFGSICWTTKSTRSNHYTYLTFIRLVPISKQESCSGWLSIIRAKLSGFSSNVYLIHST